VNWFRRFFALPLVVKELTESSARWRTYGVRVLFAVGIYGMVALLLPQGFWSGPADPTFTFSRLGIGREIFDEFIALQAVGIALFLPAMMCGCITQEKERDSLVLLLLTELRPWQILFQKYLGGLLPVLSFVLLGAPLMAVAYSLGGVEVATLIEQLLGVLLLVLQLGALTLLCSVWCRTTVASLICSYFLGAIMYVVPALIAFSLPYRYVGNREEFAFLFAPPAQLAVTTDDPLSERALALLPSVLSIFLFLGLARFFFLRRAFLPPSNLLRRVFLRLDAFMQRANRLTGGVMIIRERANLPADAPIFWRETRTRALGRPHYLLRLLLVAETITVLACLALLLSNHRGFGAWLGILSALAILVVAVHSANVIISEWVNQTLEVLLTTPLTAWQIIREKERALFRLWLVLAVPLLTVAGMDYYMRYDLPHPRGESVSGYFVALILAIVVYLPLIGWLAMVVGLWMRTRFRAIVVTLIILVVWFVLPVIVADQFQEPIRINSFNSNLAPPLWRIPPTADRIRLLSPLGVILNSADNGSWRPWPFEIHWAMLFVNFAAYGLIALSLRTVLALRADRWLRRA
jgi:ABC-type transport system involved in multi-copper enzyme maturation permease subunit